MELVQFYSSIAANTVIPIGYLSQRSTSPPSTELPFPTVLHPHLHPLVFKQVYFGRAHDRIMPSSPGREMVYCHACSAEWYRDEHGLACPRPTCGSDAVEIVCCHRSVSQ